MTVASYCEASIQIVGPHVSLRAAAEQMSKEAASLLLVTDRGRTLGVLTERDIVAEFADSSRDANSLCVADAMSKPAIAIPGDAPLGEAIALMRRKHVRNLPVLDSNRAIGVLTADHVVRVLADELNQVAKAAAAQLDASIAAASPRQPLRSPDSRTAARLMRSAISISADATLALVAAQLREAPGGCVIVVSSSDEAVGIITIRDVAVRAVAGGRSFSTELAASVMSSPLLTGDPAHTQQAILERMAAYGIRRIPILEQGRLAGVVSLEDFEVSLRRDLGQFMRPAPRERHDSQVHPRIERARRELKQRTEQLGRTLGQLAGRSMRTAGRRLEALGERLGHRQS